MDYVTSKAFVIGVGIFLTITIVSGLILLFNSIGEVYNAVENTNTSIVARFDDVYSMYSGAKLNALDLLNTLRKYEMDEQVKVGVHFKGQEIEYGSSNTQLLNELTGKMGNEYEKEFIVSVHQDVDYIYIVFNEK